jgi:hypothetical protein
MISKPMKHSLSFYGKEILDNRLSGNLSAERKIKNHRGSRMEEVKTSTSLRRRK